MYLGLTETVALGTQSDKIIKSAVFAHSKSSLSPSADNNNDDDDNGWQLLQMTHLQGVRTTEHSSANLTNQNSNEIMLRDFFFWSSYKIPYISVMKLINHCSSVSFSITGNTFLLIHISVIVPDPGLSLTTLKQLWSVCWLDARPKRRFTRSGFVAGFATQSLKCFTDNAHRSRTNGNMWQRSLASGRPLLRAEITVAMIDTFTLLLAVFLDMQKGLVL